jgi:uncharacterized protein (TIGR03643 family)
VARLVADVVAFLGASDMNESDASDDVAFNDARLWQRGALELLRGHSNFAHMAKLILDPSTVSEVIEMTLSDHVSFGQIRALQGLGSDEVKALMRKKNRKSGSYRAWRRRVQQFADRREVYK